VKFAAVDIGSNAVRLLLARVIEEGDGAFIKKEVLVRMPLRLGDDAFRSGSISIEKRARLMETMLGFKHLIAAYEPLDFAAYATSAMREARNAPEVVTGIADAAGISVEIIDGAREAEVVVANHVEQRLNPRRKYLYVDVGGGSTEVSLIVHGRMIESASFAVGTVRLLRERPTDRALSSLKTWVRERRKEHGSMTAIGSGGNINTIFKLARVRQGRPLTTRQVRAIHKDLSSRSLEERIVDLGLRPDRADVIVHASRLYLAVMKWGKIDRIHVPEVGLADGIVHLLYERHRARRST